MKNKALKQKIPKKILERAKKAKWRVIWDGKRGFNKEFLKRSRSKKIKQIK